MERICDVLIEEVFVVVCSDQQGESPPDLLCELLEDLEENLVEFIGGLVLRW